jgi:hypothetical protein
MLQTFARPAISAILSKIKHPESEAIKMIWRQTQSTWDGGRPWLDSTKTRDVYYIGATYHGREVYEGWKRRPNIEEAREKHWINEVRTGWLDVENAAIPEYKRHDTTYKQLDYFALAAKQLGCQMRELYGLLESGKIRVCASAGCEQRIKKADEFSSWKAYRKNKCKSCRAREKRERNE